jgi:hypothetical protein
MRGLRRQRKCLSSRITGVCDGRTISAASQRCLRSCTRAVVRPVPSGLIRGRPQVICLGPYSDFADLCSEPVFALVAELDEGDDDGQTSEEGAG